MNMPRTKAFVKLRKTGNSLVVTIPKDLIGTLNWKGEDELFLEIKGNVLIVKREEAKS